MLRNPHPWMDSCLIKYNGFTPLVRYVFMLWLISILFAIALIKLVRKSVPQYSPASLITIFWTVQILVMLTFFSNYLIFTYYGIVYICLCLFVFDSGYILTNIIFKPKPYVQSFVSIHEDKATTIYIIMLFLAFVGVIYSIISNGFNLMALLDFQSALDMSHQNSVDRYSGEDSGGLLTKLLAINESATTVIGGFLLPVLKGKKRFLSYSAILPPIISGLTQGAKMGIITGMFLYLSGILVGYQLLDKKLKINFKIIFLGIVLFISFLALMVVVMMFRIGKFDIDTMFVVFGKATSYALAHLPAFDIWFNSHEESIFNLTVGGKTFFGVTNFLGIMERKQGLFETMTTVSTDGSGTNVYSYFRLMVEDFGSLGSLVFLFIMGSICRIVYDNFKQKHNIYFNTVLVCGMYFFISWSFVTSVFVYTTYIVLMFYLYIIFRLIIEKKPEGQRILPYNNCQCC